jgi:serine phosphatase RsbU (regulator of sigma subunit)/pSer/pThr/pTyr-binding forkhead associated (FHA) protein
MRTPRGEDRTSRPEVNTVPPSDPAKHPPARVSDDLPPSSSGSGGWKGLLDIRLNTGPAARRLLSETHVVIGRLPTVQLVLDHHTVSRRHAEMVCDPFGRWWIRDLNSTNGTLVNEEAVTERVLQPGDKIAIGDYTLTFQLEPTGPSRPIRRPSGPLTVNEDRPTAIRTLLDFEAPRIASEHLRSLMDLSRRLLAISRPSERLDLLCQLLVKRDFHGREAMALRISHGQAAQLAGPYRPGPGDAAVIAQVDMSTYISRRVLTTLVETREPVLAGNLERPGGQSAIELTMAREVMALWVVACPIGRDETSLDAIYVTLPPECGGSEWLSLIALAAEVFQQAEAAWAARAHALAHAAIERELEMARQIQRGLVPDAPSFEHLEIAIGFDPCKWVGGDYVDVVPMADGRVLFAVADVCGKGLQAALVTSSLHTMVRATADSGRPLTELVERANKHLCSFLPNHSFVTMVFVALDPRTGEAECVNAGHPPVVVARRGAAPVFLQSASNPALGVALCSYQSEKTRLAEDDVLLLYTDGLTELRNGAKEMLGIDALTASLDQLLAYADGAVDVAGRGLTEMLDAFRGDQLPEDDRAFVLARLLR